VVAKNSAGAVLASNTAMTVLPVSDEMTCVACHASRTGGNAAQNAARPAPGWVGDADLQKDWKLNILRIHDQLQTQRNPARFSTALQGNPAAGTVGYYDPAGLEATARGGKPILCAGCHDSNALGTNLKNGISALTSALHASHGSVVDPVKGQKLDDIGNRESCSMCHPGSVTKCLRGAMGNATDAQGNALMGCQNCHGNMTDVGAPARSGWLDQPNCQACHHDGLRETTAINSATGKLRVVADTRYATKPNTPAAGFSLFRFSTDHGGLQCEACHGATHGEYPSADGNDNVLSVSLQGHSGTVRECVACHATVPTTTSGGPHGMHTVGQPWVKSHQSAAKNNNKPGGACAYCHGNDFKGTYLSEVREAKTVNKLNVVPGQRIGCYECHNGPGGSGKGGTQPVNMNPDYAGASGAALQSLDRAIANWLAGK
jgi:hypothetical protein